MKYKFFTPLHMLGVVVRSRFMILEGVACAQGTSIHTPSQQYNFTFRFCNQERLIQSLADLRVLIQGIIAYLREPQDTARQLESKVAVSTRSDDNSVLRGSVDMNDFRNGRVFFTYSEDEDRLSGDEDDYEDDYEDDDDEDINEYGNDFQNMLMDHNFDSSSYEEEVTSLYNDTEHYINPYVAYKNRDRDEMVSGGGTRNFTTDS